MCRHLCNRDLEGKEIVGDVVVHPKRPLVVPASSYVVVLLQPRHDRQGWDARQELKLLAGLKIGTRRALEILQQWPTREESLKEIVTAPMSRERERGRERERELIDNEFKQQSFMSSIEKS